MRDPMEETRLGAGAGRAPRHELFVVYAERDLDWVRGYLLPELGLPEGSVVTPERFTPGAPLAAAVERAVEDARFVVLVLTPAFLDDAWSRYGELLTSHLQVAGGGGRLVPLLLEPCQLPLRVDFRVRLDCTRQARWGPEVGRLRQLLQREEPPVERVACPYPGMMAFGRDQARFFFGRAREVDELARRLPRQRFQMVIGPSGSGKTSLVVAGLLPRLAASADATSWLVRSLRPGGTPVRSLAEALGEPSPPAPDEPLDLLVERLLERHRPARRLLLVVDQLEEVFAQAPPEERVRFLAAVGQLRRVAVCVQVLTMRADFYADLMGSDLWPLSDGERLELPPLRGAALGEAITAPAAAVGVHVERVLLERLLNDAAGEPGVLPLLQETMSLLWEQRARRLLTLDAYERLGGEGRSGLATALATRADAAFAELSPARQAIARRVLLRLVQLGEGRDDTRRQQPVPALQGATDEPAEFDATLRHLTRHRLLTLSGAARDLGEGTGEADLAHEALIAGWPTFRRWVQEDREGLRIRAQLADDVQVWTKLHRDPDTLYRGARLVAASEWAERHPGQLTVAEEEFLAAGRAHHSSELAEARGQAARQARAARRLRWSAAALSVLLLLASLATLLAVRSAGQERRLARIGSSRYLADQATTTAATNPELSILLSLAAFASADTAEARRGLQSQLIRRRHVRRILTPSARPVDQVAFSSDGRVLAAGGNDGVVHVWDGTGRTTLATLGPPAGPVQAVAVSPDGRTLASSGTDGTRLWDLDDPGRPRPLGDGKDPAASLAFTPDGRRLLSAGPGGQLVVWDLPGGRRTPIEADHDGGVEAIVATPDGRGVLSMGRRAAYLWGLDGRLVASFPFGASTAPATGTAGGAIALSRDGTRFALTREGVGTELWDLRHRTLLARARYTYGTAIAFGPGNDTVVTLDAIQSKIAVHKVAKPRPGVRGTPELTLTTQLGGHAGDVLNLAGGRDGVVASSGADGRVILWTTRPNTNVLTDPGLDGATRVSFSRDGRRLLVVDRNGVLVFDVARRQRWGQVEGPVDAALSPDGRTLATSGRGNAVALYDLDSRRLAHQLRWAGAGRSVASAGVQISPDGTRLVEKSQQFRWLDKNRQRARYEDQVLVVWDLVRRSRLVTLRAGPPAFYGGDTDDDVAFSPDGGVLAYARNDATDARDDDIDRVAMWDVRRQREIGSFDAEGVQSLAFNPAGNVLAVGYVDRIEFRDARSHTLRQNLRSPRLTAQNLAFSPDGRTLAASGTQGAFLWEVADPTTAPVLAGALVDREELGSGGLSSGVAFSPDGRLLAVADEGPEVILWDLNVRSWRGPLCQLVDRDFTDQERRRYFPDGRNDPTCPG